ncbi:NADH-quinone oxidoreductase subunit E [Sulfitobacter alexandrii]|uniref:NADH-quinone oxidoreductase subunit E n=1 Tax=Sulfitobacter alexandrii TaxID=1917485 RepID=A0A1J0WFM6_9RHOB|nr:NADH-quinone oxidoreductase subunit E [Sulfitobacter alexandrii]APE43119.1 NADH-quinone oxidoreductase subunit E [Sulfitobacter alexandrii]
MLRRLYSEQPESFAFTPANQKWAEAQMTKYPEGRQASAIIPLLWRAQEQEGWLSRPAIEHVSEMLGMAYIRGLEVATFYFMFQLQPVGSVAHIQVCGTTSCMICGAEDLMAVCKERIAPNAHELSADGKFSWEEVECLGSCANAPMAQIGKDYYEDLTAESFGKILDELAAGRVPLPGPQNGRYTSEPKAGLTSLKDHEDGRPEHNASVALAVEIGDTIKRIDGTEVPLLTPWLADGAKQGGKPARAGHDDLMPPEGPDGAQGGRSKAEEQAPRDRGDSSDKYAEASGEAPEVEAKGRPDEGDVAPDAKTDAKAESGVTTSSGAKPATLDTARDGGADNLKLIKGVGPKLEKMLNEMGFFHYDQIANWTAEEVAWVDQNLTGFKGRVSRDNWVDQAKRLAAGEETDFSTRASKDGLYDN